MGVDIENDSKYDSDSKKLGSKRGSGTQTGGRVRNPPSVALVFKPGGECFAPFSDDENAKTSAPARNRLHPPLQKPKASLQSRDGCEALPLASSF